VVPDNELLKSEFHADYARQVGFRHLIGGMLGVRCATPIAFQRNSRSAPFDDRDRRLLSRLLPHLQRALQLKERLAVSSRIQLGFDALDMPTIAVLIVDGSMRVMHANTAARRLADFNRCGLSMNHPDRLPPRVTWC
jgi:hypothetical protein